METKIFDSTNLKDAAQLIKEGEVIAFPTETVYGLGANAYNEEAIKKIFKAKNRPQDNPLIVHISRKEQVYELAEVTESAKKIMDAFWPDAIAIILKKKPHVSDAVTGGLDSIAIRMPKHELAQTFIELTGVPIAAPSANISGRPSSTNFEHAYEDLNGRVAGIIKHDASEIGVESSVLDLTTNTPILLRPGGVSLEDIQQVLPETRLFRVDEISNKSPGMKYKHYSPKAKITLFELGALEKLDAHKAELKEKGFKVKRLKLKNTKESSHDLFNQLRSFDEEGADYILINAVPENDIGLAIMNRVRKAASEIIQ